MTKVKQEKASHLSEIDIADYVARKLSHGDRGRVERHLSECEDCLAAAVSAHETVCQFNTNKKGKNKMRKINLYPLFAILSLVLSFALPKYFLQFLVVTLLLGAKWIVDSQSTRMLITVYEAWKNEGETGSSRLFKKLDEQLNRRL